MKNVSVITGGAGGMGYAAATLLAKHGSVLLLDVNEARLKECTDMLIRQNYEAEYMVLDVCDPKAVEEAAEKAASMGKIKNLINIAGISPISVESLTEEDGARKIVRINALGVYNMFHSFAPRMEDGTIISLSTSAIYRMPVLPEPISNTMKAMVDHPECIEDTLMKLCQSQKGRAYMFSKVYVKYLTCANAMRLGEKGIRALTIAPGRIYTPLHRALIEKEPERIADELATTPCHRYGNAYEVANLMEFLCSDAASFISGIDILVDGGWEAVYSTPQTQT